MKYDTDLEYWRYIEPAAPALYATIQTLELWSMYMLYSFLARDQGTYLYENVFTCP